ncbi:MAG: hypothetical protein II453_10085 [Alphaproteobacteria bacterium]|nr:hypothetical protein [Alphaproteobacteria bacterium]
MTREMNKPDWCRYPYMCGNFWQAMCIGYTIYDTCKDCKHYKPKERILNPDIKPFF